MGPSPRGASGPRKSPVRKVASGQDRGDLQPDLPRCTPGAVQSLSPQWRRPPRGSRARPTALQARAPLAALQPGSTGMLTLKLHLPAPAPRPPHAVWCHLSQLGACAAEARHPAPCRVWGRRSISLTERFKPMELRSQTFRCRVVTSMFLPSSPGPTELTADRYYGSTCVLRTGEANEEGSEGVGPREPGHYCQGAKGPGPAIV